MPYWEFLFGGPKGAWWSWKGIELFFIKKLGVPVNLIIEGAARLPGGRVRRYRYEDKLLA